jgi:hypothetical protein
MIHTKWFIFKVAFVAMILLVGTCFLPHERYIRFQQLEGAYAKAKWIYERIHFDETPIDIVFIGSSHTYGGIDSELLEDSLNRIKGRKLHVVNFAIPEMGRNMDYLLAREVLNNRRIKLLVLEVTDEEKRKPHDKFYLLADTKDILFAPVLINLNYFNDLMRLPGRQLKLFIKSLIPWFFSRKNKSIKDDKFKSTFDIPKKVKAKSGQDGYTRDITHTLAYMEEIIQRRKTKARPNVLGPDLAWLEYRYPRLYVDDIVSLAKEHEAVVRFLYLPYYSCKAKPLDLDRYKRMGKFWDPVKLRMDHTNFLDHAHLNWKGSRLLTHWILRQLEKDPIILNKN